MCLLLKPIAYCLKFSFSPFFLYALSLMTHCSFTGDPHVLKKNYVGSTYAYDLFDWRWEKINFNLYIYFNFRLFFLNSRCGNMAGSTAISIYFLPKTNTFSPILQNTETPINSVYQQILLYTLCALGPQLWRTTIKKIMVTLEARIFLMSFSVVYACKYLWWLFSTIKLCI